MNEYKIPPIPINDNHLSLYLKIPKIISDTPTNAPKKGIIHISPNKYGGFDFFGVVYKSIFVILFIKDI
jgi:hypothetical protein